MSFFLRRFHLIYLDLFAGILHSSAGIPKSLQLFHLLASMLLDSLPASTSYSLL